jgi:hypothetical protein
MHYQLTGAEASWAPRAGGADTEWKGWLPHPDIAAAADFLRGAPSHEALWKALRADGKFTARGHVALPAEARRLLVEASGKFELTVGGVRSTKAMQRLNSVAPAPCARPADTNADIPVRKVESRTSAVFIPALSQDALARASHKEVGDESGRPYIGSAGTTERIGPPWTTC